MARIVMLQIFATILITLVAGLLGGMTAALSALLGGICCVVPNGLFAVRLFMAAHRPGGTDPMAFFVGEFIKIASTMALFGAVAWLYRDVNWPAFLGGFIVVLKSYFILLFRHRP
ncbi:MAG: ATP synthase subunit I [Glaciimonas sp.]|nr:ATP synthase subunit I [Glaciimonas sp.]